MEGLQEELRLLSEGLWSRYEAETAPMVRELKSLMEKCDCAAAAAATLTNTHSSYITPAGRRWFKLQPRGKSKAAKVEDRVARFFRHLTNTVAERLAESNFYTATHEVYEDRVEGGTGACYIGGSDTEPLYFTHLPLGTFVVDDDARGRVHTLVRKFVYTPAQAEMEWGRECLSERVRAWCADPRMRHSQKVEFQQIVRPNMKQVKAGWRDIPEELRAYEGYYVESEGYHVVKREGFFEFPFLVTRYLRAAGSPYGVPPGKKVLPAIRQLVKLERLMDSLAEVQAFPRILQLAGQNKQVDMKAGGITTISEDEARLNMPREWGTGGRYDIGLDRIRDKEQAIRRAYHEDMLLSVTAQDKQMTAREVEERVAEKILAFIPSFTLFIADNAVAMRRVLGVLMRRNELALEDAPAELLQESPEGHGPEVLNPQVAYLGRIAQALELLVARGDQRVIDKVLVWVQGSGRTDMLEWIDEEALLHGWVDQEGASDHIVLPGGDIERKKMMKETAQMVQESAMMQGDALAAAGQVADIKRKMGGQ
ncbi:MAG: hypothetical protein IKJ29_06265 [Akkermansia sp.]|nr:hypothetical protein [Akkermansia sp.]